MTHIGDSGLFGRRDAAARFESGRCAEAWGHLPEQDQALAAINEKLVEEGIEPLAWGYPQR